MGNRIYMGLRRRANRQLWMLNGEVEGGLTASEAWRPAVGRGKKSQQLLPGWRVLDVPRSDASPRSPSPCVCVRRMRCSWSSRCLTASAAGTPDPCLPPSRRSSGNTSGNASGAPRRDSPPHMRLTNPPMTVAELFSGSQSPAPALHSPTARTFAQSHLLRAPSPEKGGRLGDSPKRGDDGAAPKTPPLWTCLGARTTARVMPDTPPRTPPRHRGSPSAATARGALTTPPEKKQVVVRAQTAVVCSCQRRPVRQRDAKGQKQHP